MCVCTGEWHCTWCGLLHVETGRRQRRALDMCQSVVCGVQWHRWQHSWSGRCRTAVGRHQLSTLQLHLQSADCIALAASLRHHCRTLLRQYSRAEEFLHTASKGAIMAMTVDLAAEDARVMQEGDKTRQQNFCAETVYKVLFSLSEALAWSSSV